MKLIRVDEHFYFFASFAVFLSFKVERHFPTWTTFPILFSCRSSGMLLATYKNFLARILNRMDPTLYTSDLEL